MPAILPASGENRRQDCLRHAHRIVAVNLTSCHHYSITPIVRCSLQQLQPRQVLRIHDADRHVLIIHYHQIIDPMALQKIEHLDG